MKENDNFEIKEVVWDLQYPYQQLGNYLDKDSV